MQTKPIFLFCVAPFILAGAMACDHIGPGDIFNDPEVPLEISTDTYLDESLNDSGQPDSGHPPEIDTCDGVIISDQNTDEGSYDSDQIPDSDWCDGDGTIDFELAIQAYDAWTRKEEIRIDWPCVYFSDAGYADLDHHNMALLTEAGQANLETLIAAVQQTELEGSYGCPGCTDAPIETLRFWQGSKYISCRFDLQEIHLPPAPLQALYEHTSQLRSDVRECRDSTALELQECTPTTCATGYPTLKFVYPFN